MEESISVEDISREPRSRSILRGIILLMILVLVCLAGLEIFFSWKTDHHASHASGLYVALANDLAAGSFYPPLFGNDGYRGTRYFPLYFSLHAALIKLGTDPLKAGYIVGLGAGVLLLFGVYRFVRNLGGSFYLALAAIASIIGCKLAPVLMVAIRGDILPAAINVCGLALFVRPGVLSRKRLAGLALIFSLAFAAKVTSVFGVMTVCLVLLMTKRPREFVTLAWMALLGFSVVVGLSQLASGGRFLEVVRACAAAGASINDVHRMPIRIRNTMMYLDWGTLFFLGLGLITVAFFPRKQKVHISTVYFLLALAVMVMIFTSPGTHVVHFLDPFVASVLLTASMMILGKDRLRNMSLSVIASVLLIILGLSIIHTYKTAPWKYQKNYKKVPEILAGIDGPILSDNAFIPILMGQKPFMLDAFMFRMLREKNPSWCLEKPLYNKLEEKWFAAIVLEKWATYFPGLHFGKDFYESVERNYCLEEDTKQWLFYFRCDEEKHSRENGGIMTPTLPLQSIRQNE